MPSIDQASLWYSHSDPVHGFDHILRVYNMAERLAWMEGADVEVVRAAALLHDAEGSATSSGEAGRSAHQHASADFARQVLQEESWPPGRIAAVQHCIRAHRFRDDSEPPQSLEAKVLFDADKLDAIGAIGVARAVAYAALNGLPAYLAPSEQFLATGELAPGETHSAYHEYLFKLRKLKERMLTPSGLAIAAERHELIRVFFERLALEMVGEA
jgi:uncharacterized protein